MVLWGCSPSTTKAAAVLSFWGKPPACSGTSFPQQSQPAFIDCLQFSDNDTPVCVWDAQVLSWLWTVISTKPGWNSVGMNHKMWSSSSSSQGRSFAGWGCFYAGLTSGNVSCEIPALQQDQWPWGGADWLQLPLGSVLVCPCQFLAHPAAGRAALAELSLCQALEHLVPAGYRVQSKGAWLDIRDRV